MERKLASIRRISDLSPIEGADKIELATIDGWKVVVAKDVNHKIGDLIVYCEVDSFLPIEPEFEFLRKSSYKKMADGNEGFRLKTIKLRGQISQGLILPLKDAYNVFKRNTPNMDMGWFEGLDVTEMLNIVKYEPPVPAQLAGQVKGFEKLDGSSVTYYVKDGVFGVCSRNLDLLEDENNTMWKFAITTGLREKMIGLGKNIAVQGEIIGEGIQGNPYKRIGQTVMIFNGFDIDKFDYLSLDSLLDLTKTLELKTVPILDLDFMLPDTIDELLLTAEGKSILNLKTEREGLVIRSHDRKISFKAISNKFLLNEK